jgi:hypothetical protein
LAAEYALVDEYARGQLSAEMRDRFERGYMTGPERRERARFATALTMRVDSAERPPIVIAETRPLLAWLGGWPALRFSMAFAVLLIAVGGVWFILRSQRMPSPDVVSVPAANEETLPNANLPQQDSTQPGPSSEIGSVEPSVTPKSPQNAADDTAPRTVFLALAVGGVRGSEGGRTPVLVIPRGTSQARLSLKPKENVYPSYRLSLQTVSGGQIASRSIAKPKDGASLVLTVPADKLTDGDHVLTLTGVGADGQTDDLSRSLFRVQRKN